jgi:hypothetical protein
MTFATLLDAALAYAGLGWRVLPIQGVRPDGTCTCKNAKCASPAKHPVGSLVPHGLKGATADEATIRRWWTQCPDANVGIATDGLLVVDVDPKNGGDQAQLARLGNLPVTVTAKTGSGGLHLYFRPDADVSILCTSGVAGLQGIDIRANGGYAVAPPSVHVSGIRYEWLCDPQQYELAAPPQSLLDLVREPTINIGPTGPIPEGQRNRDLYRKGRAMHARRFAEPAILAALAAENAAQCNPPLPDAEIEQLARKTVRQPDALGFALPAQATGRPAPSPQLVVTDLSAVEPEEIHWLWPGRLARGKVTLLIGDPGTGKSMLTMDLIARITTGKSWPDAGFAPVGNVILLNAEDGLADTIRPRCDAHGGDATRIRAIEGVLDGNQDRLFALATDLAALEGMLVADHFDVLVIDPLSAYLGSERDTYKDSAVRSVLAPLVRQAERHRLAVVAVMHLNKDQQKKAAYRASGSIAFTALARMVFAVAPYGESEQMRVFVPVKSNLTAPVPGLGFFIDDGVVHWMDNPVDVNAEQALGTIPLTNGMDQPLRPREEAELFLRSVLSHSPVQSQEVKRLAEAEGITGRSLQRAKRKLRVRAFRRGEFSDRKAWFWSLPTDLNSASPANTTSPASAEGDELEGPPSRLLTAQRRADDDDGDDDEE